MANYYTQYSFEIVGITPEEEQWLTQHLLQEDEDGCCPFPFFGVEDEQNPRSIWIYDDEGGSDIDVLADTLRQFLTTFRPSQCIGFSWADTCSKPRLDSFGGGAVFITAKETRFMNTWDWLNNCKVTLERGGETNGTDYQQ